MAYKNIDNGYIWAISLDAGQIEISINEYNQILDAINIKPADTEEYIYKLKDGSLTWEQCERQQEPEDETADIADYQNALVQMGVDLNAEN